MHYHVDISVDYFAEGNFWNIGAYNAEDSGHDLVDAHEFSTWEADEQTAIDRAESWAEGFIAAGHKAVTIIKNGTEYKHFEPTPA
jgi:hypothetical protein